MDLSAFHESLHEGSLRAAAMAALGSVYPPGLGARAVDVIALRAAAGAAPPAQWHSLLAALLLGSMAGNISIFDSGETPSVLAIDLHADGYRNCTACFRMDFFSSTMQGYQPRTPGSGTGPLWTPPAEPCVHSAAQVGLVPHRLLYT